LTLKVAFLPIFREKGLEKSSPFFTVLPINSKKRIDVCMSEVPAVG